MLVYKMDSNITIIDYKGAIVANYTLLNKSSHTASSQTTS